MKPRLTAVLAMSMSLLVLSGCGTVNRSAVRSSFEEGQQAVYIGMDRSEFDRAMAKNVNKTKRRHRRSSEAYQRNGLVYEIVYLRSNFYLDDAATDDEYTPYLFQDKTLIGYGWAAVGGKKTDSADIARARASASTVEQNVNVNTQPNNPFVFKTTCVRGNRMNPNNCP